MPSGGMSPLDILRTWGQIQTVVATCADSVVSFLNGNGADIATVHLMLRVANDLVDHVRRHRMPLEAEHGLEGPSEAVKGDLSTSAVVHVGPESLLYHGAIECADDAGV